MNGVAEGVEDSPPHGRCQDDAPRRCSSALRYTRQSSQAGGHRVPRGRAEVPPPRQTVATTPANDVALSAHHLAAKQVDHVRADGRHFPLELVPYHHRHRNGSARPRVPLQDMQIRSADRRPVHTDEHIVDADLRYRDFLQPEPRLRPALHQRLHLLRDGFAHSHSPRQRPEPRTITGCGADFPIGGFARVRDLTGQSLPRDGCMSNEVTRLSRVKRLARLSRR